MVDQIFVLLYPESKYLLINLMQRTQYAVHYRYALLYSCQQANYTNKNISGQKAICKLPKHLNFCELLMNHLSPVQQNTNLYREIVGIAQQYDCMRIAPHLLKLFKVLCVQLIINLRNESCFHLIQFLPLNTSKPWMCLHKHIVLSIMKCSTLCNTANNLLMYTFISCAPFVPSL